MSNVEAIDCEYIVEGSGPDLVLIHGIGACYNTWDGVVPLLQDRYRCIRYDLRGHARSPMPAEPFTLDHLVADLERIFERLNIQQAHVAGHSLGGMIAPMFALKHPEQTLSMGLLSTAAGRTDEEKAKVIGLVEAMEQQGVAPLLDQLVIRWFTDEFIESHPEVVEARRQKVLDTDETIFLNVFRIYAETEMAPVLSKINTPALVMTGELDGGCNPRINKFIASELSNAKLEILPGLKHAIFLQDPARAATHMGEFLDDQVRPGK